MTGAGLPGRIERDIGEVEFVGVADDVVHTGQGGDLFRGTLGVAAGDDDLAAGILPANTTDGGAGVLIGGGGDGTGVEDNELGGVGSVGG